MMRNLVVTLVILSVGAATATAEDKVDFAKQVLPILQESCGKCHGEKKAAAKLRVHTAAALKEKWDADKGLITPGKPDQSDLYKRITLPKDDKKRMPKGGEPLAKDKIDLIGRWIKEGALLPIVAAVATPTSAPVPAKPATPRAAQKKDVPKKPVEVPLPKVAAAPKDAIDKLTAAGAQVMPLFADSS